MCRARCSSFSSPPDPPPPPPPSISLLPLGFFSFSGHSGLQSVPEIGSVVTVQLKKGDECKGRPLDGRLRSRWTADSTFRASAFLRDRRPIRCNVPRATSALQESAGPLAAGCWAAAAGETYVVRPTRWVSRQEDGQGARACSANLPAPGPCDEPAKAPSLIVLSRKGHGHVAYDEFVCVSGKQASRRSLCAMAASRVWPTRCS